MIWIQNETLIHLNFLKKRSCIRNFKAWMTIKIKWINVYFALIWSIWASFYNITNESNLMTLLVFSGIFILTYIFLFMLKSNWVKNSSFGFFFLKLFWCEYLNPFTYCSLVLFLILFFQFFWHLGCNPWQPIGDRPNNQPVRMPVRIPRAIPKCQKIHFPRENDLKRSTYVFCRPF